MAGSTRAAEIAADLASRIRLGGFQPGSRLPTEEALCQQFGVSRTLVREAISRLKADGVVRSRRGSGLFVAEPFERRAFRVDNDLGKDIEGILSILELRQPIETAAARLAASRCTQEDLARIREAHKGFAEAPEWNLERDLLFHLAIASATHNVHYAEFMSFIGSIIGDSISVMRAASRQKDVDGVTVDEHERILRAIEAGDAEAAGLAMQLHLVGARNRMKAIG